MDQRKIIQNLIEGKDLTKSQAKFFFFDAFRGRLPESKLKAVLLLLAKKGETADEISGCIEAIRLSEPVLKSKMKGLIDTCGTGGDQSHSLNISTLAAFVIAGAGGKVAKHGNRSVSSRCGSSDLIESLGCRLDAGSHKMIKSIEKNGIGYFHAPLYHPAFKKVQALRKKLKVRTLFNLVGPLINPLGVRKQVLGVSKREHVKLYAEVLRQRTEKAVVCHSADGMDEISLSSNTLLAWIQKGRIRYEIFNPQAYGLQQAKMKQFIGGSVRKNRDLSFRILNNRGPRHLIDIVITNAAAGLVLAGISKNMTEGICLARKSLSQGLAYKALKGLVKATT